MVVALALTVVLISKSPAPQVKPAGDTASCRQHLAHGEKHLGSGAFRQAVDELTAARLAWQGQLQLLTTAEGQHLEQLWRQASVLADLSAETLEEILHHASGTAEGEWVRELAQRYQGKALVFDLNIRAAPGRHFEHPYRLWARDEPAQLDLDALTLLHPLPLDPPKRVLFAARLASVQREVGRGWVIRLMPDSGVLLTDAGAVRACCPALGDAETVALLQRQKAWVEEIGGSPAK
jgi:hypothetical protein